MSEGRPAGSDHGTEGPLASWDVFHGDRLELERGLSTAAIREALARGELRDDDLVRPAGTTVAWARLAEIPELLEPAETSPRPIGRTDRRRACRAHRLVPIRRRSPIRATSRFRPTISATEPSCSSAPHTPITRLVRAESRVRRCRLPRHQGPAGRAETLGSAARRLPRLPPRRHGLLGRRG